MEPLVYIIIVNYNNIHDTLECIDSIKQISYKNYKIIVVDNNSKDNSSNIIKNLYSDILLIQSSVNLGFAGGNNLGIEEAIKKGADYILILNNDTVVDKSFLTELVKSGCSSDDIGVVGSKINYYDNKNIISYAGGEIIWEKFTTKFYRYKEYDNIYEEEKEVSFVSGCAMLIKRSTLEEVGVLDDMYFMYYEDTDYCVRVLEKGYKLIYQPNSIVYHKVSSSSGGDLSPFVLYWSTRNRQKFRDKFHYKVDKFGLIYFDMYNFITRIIRIILYYISFKFDKGNAIFKGYIDGFKNK